MAKLLALLTIGLVIVMVHGQNWRTDPPPEPHPLDSEILVSSDLYVRRKSKENRQGKKLLSNVPSDSTSTLEEPKSPHASRLVSSDEGHATKKTERREIEGRYLDLGVAGYLLINRK